MDFISWLLALIGIGSDRAMHRSDRRAEVIRLNAEVAGEAGRILDILAMATPRLTRLASQVATELPDMQLAIVAFLDEHRNAALQLIKMTEDNKVKISTARGIVDWDKTLHDYQEWRVTASRGPPWVQGIVDRYDAIFLEAGIR